MIQKMTEFEAEAHKSRPSFLRELVYFLATTKKWWLLPILLCLGILALLVLFASTGAAPFIYTLF